MKPFLNTKAFIMADQLDYEFVPLSLEKPKGLWTVRGECLTERLIHQAVAAGIQKITLAVGYQKEKFAYLKDIFDIQIFENNAFKKQSGLEALNLSETEKEDSIFVDAGNYYEENPFLNPKASAAPIASLDELRAFDPEYLLEGKSEILRNIRLVFHCEENEIGHFSYLKRQQTNTSMCFEINVVKYIYRYPAEGIEEQVNWKNEKQSTIIAKNLGIDPTYIYADYREGWKIMEFIGPHGKPDYTSFEDSKKIVAVFRKLHRASVRTDYGMKPWEEAEEKLSALEKLQPGAFESYRHLHEQIKCLYEKTVGDGVEKCFCHGDAYRANWMMMPDGQVILFDWEYAGTSDPGIDIGYYIADAAYTVEEAERFILEYLQDGYSEQKMFHFLTYTALISYYWYLCALIRRASGDAIPDYEYKYGFMAKRFAEALTERLNTEKTK